jgi:hypothetical protein
MQVILTRSYTCRVAQKVVVQSIYKQCKYNCPNEHNCAKHIQILINFYMTFHSQRMVTLGLALEVSSNLGIEL